jgi:hypothetical protein
MLTTNNIYTTAFQLERKIQSFNGEDGLTDWYQTYDVLYLDPIDNKFKIVQAWPSFSETGTIWTKIEKDIDTPDTIILNDNNIYLTLKHYEMQEKDENNP